MPIESSFSFENELYCVRITLPENNWIGRIMILIGGNCIYTSHTTIVASISAKSIKIDWNDFDVPKNRLGYVKSFIRSTTDRTLKDFISEPAQKLVEEQLARILEMKVFL